jgi:D-arabinose 1-dehydrogenase-like Zn-dependent alcohol dehydrogenase
MMQAIQVPVPGGDFEFVQREIPEPLDNEVLIRVEACGICHGDAVTKEGHFPGITYPRIPGHEVVGKIQKVGTKVSAWKTGQRVGVGWHAGHCFQCEPCRRGDFWNCVNATTTGISSDGGYAEFMVARSEALVAIPDAISSVDAAPLLCAGRTTLGALQASGAQGGDFVAVAGIGGLGHLAVQYARKLGFRTAAISRGSEKKSLAKQLGAHVFIDTKTASASEELKKQGGAKVILCTAPNAKLIADLMEGLCPGGRLIVVAFTRETLQVPAPLLLVGGRSISGWVGGNIDDALRFSVLAGVKPMVETLRLEDARAGYEKMMSSTVHFRGVLKMG